MKKSSRPTFDNILLKRWLLKVGPVRRRTLLTKFRADLVRLGLSQLAWREGLLQLSSRPFVRLVRDPTIQVTRKNRMKGPKSRRDENNNNDPMIQGSRSVSSSLCNDSQHKRNERQELLRVDITGHGKCSTSGPTSLDKHSKDNLKKSASKAGGSVKKCSSESGKSREQERPRGKKKHWIPAKGSNPNGIRWRLIPIDMENPAKSPHPKLLELRQAEKKRKKDRLYAKFLEIFGEDIDPSENEPFLQNSKTPETSKGGPVAKTRCIEEAETHGIEKPKSPIFAVSGRKKRKESHACGTGKKLKTGNVVTRTDSTSSDNTSYERGEDTSLTREELLNTLQDDSPITDSSPATETLSANRRIADPQDLVVQESNTNKNSTSIETAESVKRKDSRLGNECQREERAATATPELGSIFESDNEHSVTTNASQSSVEMIPVIRHQSVIVKMEERRSKPFEVSSNELNATGERESIVNQEVEFTSEAETRSSSISDGDRSILEVSLDSTESQIPNSPEIQISEDCKTIKNEPRAQCKPPVSPQRQFERDTRLSDKQPLNIGSSNPRDSLDNDPNPSSTTDTESSSMLRPEIPCSSDRLFGAMDNIFLALHYRRRVHEREQTVSKLAMQRNRQGEILKAKYELESKLIIFRDELRYICTRLDTWDTVLRFINRGLNHRTPEGTQPFSTAEVEAAMLEAEIKIPMSIKKKVAEPVQKSQSNKRVLCTIDLTVDDRDDNAVRDPCDSSTDPPRPKNYLNVIPKFESVNEADHLRTHDLNANAIQQDFPRILEVKTISPQQYEKIEESLEFPTSSDEDPCESCSRASILACCLCYRAFYCSKTCQEKHWKVSHHSTCVPIQGGTRSCEK